MLICKFSYDEEISTLLSINKTAIDFLESRMKADIKGIIKYCKSEEIFEKEKNKIIQKYKTLAEPYFNAYQDLLKNNKPKIEITKKDYK